MSESSNDLDVPRDVKHDTKSKTRTKRRAPRQPTIEPKPGAFPVQFDALAGQYKNEESRQEFPLDIPTNEQFLLAFHAHSNTVRGNQYTPANLRASFFIALAKKLYHCTNSRVASPALASLGLFDFEVPSIIFKMADTIGDFDLLGVRYEVRSPLTAIYRCLLCAHLCLLFPRATMRLMWLQTESFRYDGVTATSVHTFGNGITVDHVHAINRAWHEPINAQIDTNGHTVSITATVQLPPPQQPVPPENVDAWIQHHLPDFLHQGYGNIAALSGRVDVTAMDHLANNQLLGVQAAAGVITFDLNVLLSVLNVVGSVHVTARHIINGRMVSMKLSGLTGCGSVVQAAYSYNGRVHSPIELSSAECAAAFFCNFQRGDFPYPVVYETGYESDIAVLNKVIEHSFPSKKPPA